MAVTREQLVEFLEDQGLDIVEDNVADDTQLFSSNLLDSFKMVELIMLVEKACGIRVGPAELTLENFDTIESIMSFANSKGSSV